MSDSGELAHRAHQLLESGEVTAEGLDQLMAIAMRDGVVDEEERQVLRELIGLLDVEDASHDLRVRLDALRDQFDI